MATEVETVQLTRASESIDVQSVAVGGAQALVATHYVSGVAAGHAIAFAPAGSTLPNAKVSTINVTTGTLAAGNITGANDVTLISTNATPGNQLCRSAAAMLGDIGAGVGSGLSYNTFRDFVVNFTSGTTATITDIGKGTYD
jgi:hypothetical protein